MNLLDGMVDGLQMVDPLVVCLAADTSSSWCQVPLFSSTFDMFMLLLNVLFVFLSYLFLLIV